jgi:phosphate transport system protein
VAWSRNCSPKRSTPSSRATARSSSRPSPTWSASATRRAKIARFAIKVYDSDRIVTPRYNEIKYMAGMATKMLRESLDAFARLDVSRRRRRGAAGHGGGRGIPSITRHLITFMMEDPRTISTFIDLLFVVKAIERIGDHAKNMSEYVVFMVKGKDVRHTTIEDVERDLQEAASRPL